MKYLALLLTLITVSAFADGFIAPTGGAVTDGSSITNIQYTNIVGVGVTPLAATNQGNTYNGSFEGPALSLADTNRLIVILPYYKTINGNTNQIFTNYLGNYYRPGGYNAADFYLKKIGAYWVFTCDSFNAAADRTNYSKNITGVYELGLNEGASLKYGALVRYDSLTNSPNGTYGGVGLTNGVLTGNGSGLTNLNAADVLGQNQIVILQTNITSTNLVYNPQFGVALTNNAIYKLIFKAAIYGVESTTDYPNFIVNCTNTTANKGYVYQADSISGTSTTLNPTYTCSSVSSTTSFYPLTLNGDGYGRLAIGYNNISRTTIQTCTLLVNVTNAPAYIFAYGNNLASPTNRNTIYAGASIEVKQVK